MIRKYTGINRVLFNSVMDELSCLLILFLELIAFLMFIYLSINVAFSAESEWSGQQHQEVTLNEITQGSLLYKTDVVGRYIPAPTVKTDVEIKITGMIARVIVSQEFKNNSKNWQEGIYVFPLPEDAAVDHLKMIVGDRVIVGKIKKRAEARRIYNVAKKQGRKASLIEQHRPNMFQNSIANIGPGETVSVVIEYQHSIKYQVTEKNSSNRKAAIETIGEFNLRFPMTITPRYIPGKVINEKIELGRYNRSSTGWAENTDQVADAALITPPSHSISTASNQLNKISLRVELNSGFPIDVIKSKYHRVSKVNHAEGIYTVTLIDEQLNDNNIANHDFNLVWQTAIGKQPRAAVFSEQRNGEFYNLLMIMPPTKFNKARQTLAREVIYILDTSGSMGGASIRQARKALLMAIDRLGDSETFNIIEFNSSATKLFTTAVNATRRNKEVAKYFVRNLVANGGTEMATALNLAFEKNSHSNNRIRQIVFLTDGSVGNEDGLFRLIKNSLGNSRLFTIGIGSAPNSHFMTKAASFGRGTFTYIGSTHEVQQKMAGLFSKLESPVLKNIKIDYNVDGKIEFWPKTQPDLYLGEPIIVVSKSKNKINNVTVSADLNNNRWNLDLNTANTKENDGIAVLWARKKIRYLMDSLLDRTQRDSQSKDALKKEITTVALKHHLVSKYTSLVAVELTPSRKLDELLKTSAIKNNRPKGTHAPKVYQRLAQTATTAELDFIKGLLLLFVAVLMFWYQQKSSRESV